MRHILTPVLAADSAAPSYKSLDSFGETPGVSKGFTNVGNNLLEFAHSVTTFGIALFAIVTLLVGIGCIFAGEEYRGKLKKIFPWTLGAMALMVLAKTVANVILSAAT